MKNINIEEVKRYLKRSLKKKVKITTSLIVLFMMSNSIGMAAYITVDDGKIGSLGKNNISRGSIALNPKTEKNSDVQHQVVKDYAIAIGLGAEANNSDSVSIGHSTKANAVNSVAIGKEAEVTGAENDAIAIGYQAKVMQSDKTGANGEAGSIAIGKNARTWLIKSTAIGIDSEVVSLNTFDKASANGGGQGLAIGSGSKAVDQATSLGNETYAIGRSSIAIGSDDNDRFQEKITKEDFNHYFKKLFKVIDESGTGYGYDKDARLVAPNKLRYSPTLAEGEGGIAFGTRALSYGIGATSIGAFSYALGDYSIAMGAKTRAEGNGAIAIGSETKVFSDNSVAVGNKNEVSENGGMAYGYNAISSGNNTIAIGSNVYGNVNIKTDVSKGVHKQYNDSNNDDFTVSTIDTDFDDKKLKETLGKLEKLYKDDQSYTTPALVDKKLEFNGKEESTGKKVKPSNGNNAIVVGTDSVAKGENSITFGHAAFGMQDNTVSIGSYTYVNGKNSLGLGIASRVFSDNSLSIGVGSVITHNANSSLVFGNSSVVKAKNSLAIGNYSKAELENSISIGNHSNTDYNPEWLEEPGYAPKGAIFTLTSKGIGVVSIGTIGKERRLTNLASGYRDTDAVNVSQLRSLEEKLSTVNPDEEDTSMMNYLSVDKKNTSGEGYKAKEIAMKEVYYKEYIKLKAKALEMEVRKTRNDEHFKDEYEKKITDRIKKLEEKGIKAINDAKTNAYGQYTDGYIKNKTKTVDTILKEISESKDKALAKKQDEILNADEIAEVKKSNYNNDGATGADSIALGYGANAKGSQAVAIGKNAEGKGNQSVVIGTPNSGNGNENDTTSNIGEISAGESSVSVGNGVKSGNYSVGIGGNVVSGDTAVAIGDRARAIGKFGIAIGEKAKVEKENGIAFGNIATSTEKNAIAIGNSSKATKENAIALGQGAKSEQNDSVAIGNGSEAKSSTDKAYLTDDTNNGGRTFAVGGTSIKRRITGVADGSADSDAVTVAQLKKLSEKGITFKDDNDTKTTVGLAEEIKISGKEENTNGKYRNISVTTNNKNLEVALSNTLKGITSIENGNNSAKLTLNNDNIAVNSKKITGLANGSGDTDAVTYGQVKNPFKVAADNNANGVDQALGKKIEITGRKSINDGTSEAWDVKDNNPKKGRYTTENIETFVSSSTEGTKVLVGLREDPTFKKITLKDGDNKQVELTPTTDSLSLNSKKISGLSNGTNDTDAVAYGQVKKPFKVVADNNANGVDHNLGNKIEITGRKSINDSTPEAWDVKDNNSKKGRYTTENIETFVRTSGEGTQVLVGLREDPTFKKVTAGGENKTEITDSGINITKKVIEKNNKVDKVVKFGIDDKGNATLTDSQNTTASPIVTEATVGNQKIKYKANSDDKTKKETTLTTGFNFSGGTNTEAEVGDNGVVKFNLKDKLTGITSIEKGTNGTKITLNENDITVNKKITGLADGDISASSTDAVNGKQLNTVKTTADAAKSTADTVSDKITALEGKKLGFTGNSGTKVEKKLGEDIAIKGDDSSITTEAKNNAITITVKDKGITSAKIADKNITEGKLDEGLLTKINAGNAVATNTITLSGDNGADNNPTKTSAVKLNTTGGISFGIKGADGIETTAKGTDVTVKLKDAYKTKLDNLADNANDKYAYKDATNLTGLTDDEKAKWREAIGLGNAVSGTGILSIEAFTTKGTTEESKGTSKVKLDGKENFKLVGKDGITVESDSDKKLTFGLDQATKDKLSNITKVSDGKDGKNGTDGTTTAGSQGLTGKDGLNGKNLTDKVNALRNGEAGTVVFTNEDGERLIKGNDGKYYKPNQLEANGDVKEDAKGKGVENPELRVVNANGETTKATTLNNLASALSNRDAGKAITAEKAKGVVEALLTKTDGLDKAVNLADLQAIAQAGLDFSGNTGVDTLHHALGTKLQIVGEGTPAADFGGASDNINVKAIEDATNKISKLEIQLTKALKNIESIQNGDTKITLDKDKGVAINGKDGGTIVVKGKDNKDGVSIKGGDGTNTPTIAFNKTADNKGTGTITGLKDFDVNDKDYGKKDSGIAATQKEVKDVLNKINANGTEQDKLKNGTLGTVVYTDKDGNRVYKNSNGQFYVLDEDNKELNISKENIILSTVNSDGKTIEPITLGNVASALGLSKDSKNNSEILKKLVNKEAKKDVYKDAELNKVVTLRDLQFLASKGITFAGSTGTATKFLGDTITINGSNSTDLTKDNFATKYETKNIAVKVDNTNGNIEVGLAKELKNINSIENDKTKLSLAEKGIEITKQGEQNPFVSIKAGDTTKGPSIDFATKEEGQGNDKKTVGTGSITGLEYRKASDTNNNYGTGANIGRAATEGAVKEIYDKLSNVEGNINTLNDKGLTFVGNSGDAKVKKLGDTVNIKGEGTVVDTNNKFESAKGNINVKANDDGVELQLAANLKNMKSFETENDKDGNNTKLDQKGLTITDKDDKNSGTKENPRNTVEITKDKIVFKKEYKDGTDNKSDNGIVIDNSKGTISGVKDGDTPDSVVTKGYIDNKLKSLDGNNPFEYYEKNKDTVFAKDGTEYKAGTIVAEDGKVYAKGTQEVEGKYFPEGDKVVKAKDGKFYKEKDIKDRTYDEATKKWSGDSAQPKEATEAKALEDNDLNNAKAENKVVVKGKNNKFYEASDLENAEYDETKKEYTKDGNELKGKEAKDVVIKALPNNEAMTLTNIANARLVKNSKDAVNAGQMLEELDKKMNKDGSNIDKKGFANNMSKGANIEKPEGILVTDKQVNEHLSKNYYNKTEVDAKVSDISNTVVEANKKSDLALGGVANAVAMANLVQVNSYSRHRHNLSAAYGYYGGAHALAIGFSGTNEERNFVYKLSGSVNNKGNLAFGVGAGVMLGEEHDTFPNIDNKKIKEVTKKLDEANKKISEYEDDKKQTAKKFKELEDKYENDKKESNKKLQEMERKLEMLMKKFK